MNQIISLLCLNFPVPPPFAFGMKFKYVNKAFKGMHDPTPMPSPQPFSKSLYSQAKCSQLSDAVIRNFVTLSPTSEYSSTHSLVTCPHSSLIKYKKVNLFGTLFITPETKSGFPPLSCFIVFGFLHS